MRVCVRVCVIRRERLSRKKYFLLTCAGNACAIWSAAIHEAVLVSISPAKEDVGSSTLISEGKSGVTVSFIINGFLSTYLLQM